MDNAKRFDEIAAEIRENETDCFTFDQAQDWSDDLGLNRDRPYVVIQALKARGLKMVERNAPKRIRTLGSNPHDRWQASPSHGGCGGSCIIGFAGNAG